MKINKVMELIELALKVNSKNGKFEDRGEKGKPCVFIRYSPHVSKLDVDVYENGFEGGIVHNYYLYCDGLRGKKDNEEYRKCKKHLLKLLEVNNES